MRRVVIFFAASRFTGVASDAIIGIEIKSVLLVAVRVLLRLGFIVDDEILLAQVGVIGNRIDRLAVTVDAIAVGVLQQGVGGFIVSFCKHLFGPGFTWFKLSPRRKVAKKNE